MKTLSRTCNKWGLPTQPQKIIEVFKSDSKLSNLLNVMLREWNRECVLDQGENELRYFIIPLEDGDDEETEKLSCYLYAKIALLEDKRQESLWDATGFTYGIAKDGLLNFHRRDIRNGFERLEEFIKEAFDIDSFRYFFGLSISPDDLMD